MLLYVYKLNFNEVSLIVRHLIHLRRVYIDICEIQLRKFKFLLEKKVWSMNGNFIAQSSALEGIKYVVHTMLVDMYFINRLVKSEISYK